MTKNTHLTREGFLNAVKAINKQIDPKFALSKEKALELYNKEISPYGYPSHQKMIGSDAIEMYALNSCIINNKFKGLKNAPTVGSGFALDLSNHVTYYILDDLAESLMNTDVPKDSSVVQLIKLDVLPVFNVVFSNDFEKIGNEKSSLAKKISIAYVDEGLSIQIYQGKANKDSLYYRFEFLIPFNTDSGLASISETQKYFFDNNYHYKNYYSDIATRVDVHGYDAERFEMARDLMYSFSDVVIPQVYKFVINLLCLMTSEPDIISVEKPKSNYVPTNGKGFNTQKMSNVPNVHWLGADFTTSVKYFNTLAAGNGSAKKSHWRRGHWHTISQGPGRLQKKLRWFKPVFIKGHKQEVES